MKRENLTRGIIIAMTFFFWLSAYPYVPIISAYARDLGADATMIGLIGGAYGLSMMLLRLPVGILSDRLGRRKIFIVLGVVGALIAAGVVLLHPSPMALFICRIFCGVQASAWVPYTVLYAHSYPPEQSAKAMSVLTPVFTLAQLISMLAGGILADRFTYLAPFWLALAGSVLFLVLSPAMKEVPAEALPKKTGGESVLAGIKAVVTPRLLLLSLVGTLAYYLKYATAFTFTPLIAKDLGASDAALGYLNTIYCACGIAGGAVAYRVARRCGAAKTMAGAMVGLAIFSCFVVPFLPNLPLVYVSIGLAGFFTILLDGLLAGLVIKGVDERHRTTAMGFYQAVYGFGILLGPVVSGWVTDLASGSMVPAYILAGILTLVVAAVVLLWNRKQKLTI